jgi:hypothetical protein
VRQRERSGSREGGVRVFGDELGGGEEGAGDEGAEGGGVGGGGGGGDGVVGAFLMMAVKKAVVLVAVGGVLVLVLVAVTWNCVWGRRGLLVFVRGNAKPTKSLKKKAPTMNTTNSQYKPLKHSQYKP